MNALTVGTFDLQIEYSVYHKMHLKCHPDKKLCISVSTEKGNNLPVFKDTFKSMINKVRSYVLDPYGICWSTNSVMVSNFIKMLDAVLQ